MASDWRSAPASKCSMSAEIQVKYMPYFTVNLSIMSRLSVNLNQNGHDLPNTNEYLKSSENCAEHAMNFTTLKGT